jgi:hypothetical protein
MRDTRNLVRNSIPTETLPKISLPSKLEISKPMYASQRFLPTNSADVAFDTKTGSLCKTWNWQDHDAYGTKTIGQQTDTCERIVEFEQRQEAERAVAMARNPKGD